jgi:flagellar L-ring protein precursor FlgH
MWPPPAAALIALVATTPGLYAAKKDKAKLEPQSGLDRYLAQALAAEAPAFNPSIGSTYVQGARLADLVRDPRASQVGDIVTILVSDKASATSTGTTNTARKSSSKAGVQSLAGPLKATGALANLASMTGDQQLQGQGTTSRQSTFTTTLSARVTHVLPSGNLVVEGNKDVWVNSERQSVTVRGILRPTDLSATNIIQSDRLADLEVRINGKGVVGDSIRRPFVLYRILMGLLPF